MGGDRYTRGEEIANGITHGVGLTLSVAGLAILITLALLQGEPRRTVSVSIYGATLVLLYLTSTCYHSVQAPRAKSVLRILDHSAIYLLIAGTYTPYTLVSLRGPWGWTLFGITWGLSVVGIACKVACMHRFRILSLLVYLGMGWLVLVAVKPVLASIPLGGIAWIVAGGLCYTGGTVFYAWRRIPYHHAVWHIFVMAGSICHYFGILLYVLPARV